MFWKIIGEPFKKGRTKFVLCECVCGTQKDVRLQYLNEGRSKSCGCMRNRLIGDANRTHGEGKWKGRKETPEYRTWRHIKERCYNPNTINFDNYGGRGVVVCDRWLNSYERFLEDMGRKPSKYHSIDRIDHDGDYSPDNCRWATSTEQANNTRCNVIYEYKGKNYTRAEICREFNITYSAFRGRIKRGWSLDNALNTPVK